MSLFIDKSISRIVEDYNNGCITKEDILGVCLASSEKYKEYCMWASFSKDTLINDYSKVVKEDNDSKKLTLNAIPIGIKDVINTIEYPTQMGSEIWKGFEAGNDARIVYSIKRHGGIVAGKTVTAEFAVHSLNETLNPHDVSRTPGTSSSGSAVAVALGIVPVAMATQTAGSIVRPSSFCGTFGYVPSFGLIPRTGVLKTTDSLDTIGFITSRVDNLRVVLDAVRVKGLDYPFVYRAFSDINRQARGQRKWRIAFVRTYIWDNADDYVKDTIEEFVDRLRTDSDIELVEETIDAIIEEAHSVHRNIYEKCLSYYFENEYQDRDHVSEIMNSMIENGHKVSEKVFHDSLNKQDEICKSMDSFLKQYDAVISISTSSIAPLRNVREKDDPSLIWTLSHLPAVSVPQFVESNTGMPFGVQFFARRYNDGLLIELLEYLADKGFIRDRIIRPEDFLNE